MYRASLTGWRQGSGDGHSAHIRNAGDAVHTDIPTCHFRDQLSDARKSMNAEGSSFCVATNEDRVVVGMLYGEDARAGDGDAVVEEAMRSGPTTIRASEPLEPLVERMKNAGVDGILVTDPEGRLLGLLDRHKAEQALKRASA
jgi:CBS domain-containing protein